MQKYDPATNEDRCDCCGRWVDHVGMCDDCKREIDLKVEEYLLERKRK